MIRRRHWSQTRAWTDHVATRPTEERCGLTERDDATWTQIINRLVEEVRDEHLAAAAERRQRRRNLLQLVVTLTVAVLGGLFIAVVPFVLSALIGA